MRRILAIAILAIVLAGCSSKQSDLPQKTEFPVSGPSLSGYLCIFDSAVDFLQFTVSSGTLTGTEQEVFEPQGSLQWSNIDRPISGTVNGSQVTIDLGRYSESGTFDGSKLELAVHQQDGSLFNATYNPATTDDYNN